MKLTGPRAGVAVSLLWAGLAENPKVLFHLHVPIPQLQMLQCFHWLWGEEHWTLRGGGDWQLCDPFWAFALPPSFPEKSLLWWEGCALPGGASRSVSPEQHLGPLQACRCPEERAVGSGEGLG